MSILRKTRIKNDNWNCLNLSVGLFKYILPQIFGNSNQTIKIVKFKDAGVLVNVRNMHDASAETPIC